MLSRCCRLTPVETFVPARRQAKESYTHQCASAFLLEGQRNESDDVSARALSRLDAAGEETPRGVVTRLLRMLLTGVVFGNTAVCAAEPLPAPLARVDGLVAFWDFNEPAGQPRVSRGPHALALQERKGPIERTEAGVFGPHAARIKRGQWFIIERKDVGPLDIHGKDAQVSVVTWVRRVDKSPWQAIAGVWDETRKKRQYCLFLNAPRGTRADEMKRYPLANRIHGHVSAIGGPTPGDQFCITYSSGATEIPMRQWQCLAMTYDGRASRVYVNGKLDALEQYNPFPYPDGLFDGVADGADFTVGAVHRGGTWGNFFGGQIGGLAIFKRALSESEMQTLAQGVPLPKPAPAAAP